MKKIAYVIFIVSFILTIFFVVFKPNFSTFFGDPKPPEEIHYTEETP